ncbi:hypothetical protein [Bacillus gaemokensis]|uniref:Lipoprotein n=1 Tax=Bacillus gaemokensis TaxID=574375 RepID=A0A073K7Q2_9BACI|nr:hypothetical protein [Bacillus gaemokensis]KEK22462.1 hypothetical protein BAGA_18820 [Bacillus gaemokensis]KYG28843.1 hypothetical protein AZF08_14055 [Bacillus gaemokensis]
MKKRLILTLAFTLSVGSLVACSEDKAADKTESKVESTSSTSETREAPTKRTVDLKSETYPWRFASRDIIKDWQNKGETVYLWSDANAIEEYITKEITRENKHKQEDLPRSAEYVHLFIAEVKKQKPDQKEYFDKMSEAVNDMKAVNIDGAKTKIEEAKKLREAK